MVLVAVLSSLTKQHSLLYKSLTIRLSLMNLLNEDDSDIRRSNSLRLLTNCWKVQVTDNRQPAKIYELSS
jgi:hypothetical protein